MSESSGFELDNPMLVRWEFASEERLATRNAIYRELSEGDNAEDFVVDAVAEAKPGRVLDVGCGAGELAERFARLGASVRAIDTSERMVALTRERGIDAFVADAQALPFDDDEFDVVVAAWVLYHVQNRDLAISECARVLRPGGRLVAATVHDDNLGEMWEFLGHREQRKLTFSTANGAEQLERHFVKVEARQAVGVYEFPTPERLHKFVAADITRAHLSGSIPAFTEPVRARSHHTVFVAEKA